jgi:flagellar basal body-associated protein FliL
MIRGICIIAAATLDLAGPAQAAGGGGHGETAAAEPAGSRVTSSPNFVPLEMLTATVSRDYRVNGVLQIDAGLEISDPALRARAMALKPRLRDAYTATLAEYAGGAYRPGRPPDAVLIGDMLQAATDRTLGQDGADFLLGMVILH